MSILSCASQEALQQGHADYEAGRVERLARRSDGCCTGILLDCDGNRYVTTIDPTHPRKSLCTCPRAEKPRVICRHMVALSLAAVPRPRKKVAFICVHNSCRSQIAEALGKHLAADVFESFSAGTETKPQINQDAVRLMKQRYGIDMEATQYSKLLSDIPAVDVVITMGCNVQCPTLPCSLREDWGLEDPTGKDDPAFLETIRLIEEKVLELKHRLLK